MFSDVLCIVDVLGCEGVELILRGGADPAVGGHPQLLGIPLMVGFDPDDPPLLAIQCKASADAFFFRGRSPPPCSNTTYHNHYCKATAFCKEIQKEIGIVAPVCTAIRTATCSSSVLGKPARFSAAKRFRMPQKSTFLSCMICSFYSFSDGTNTGAAERGDGGIGSRYVRGRENAAPAFLPSGKGRGRAAPVSRNDPRRFRHLFSPIRHDFPDCWAVNWSAAGAAHGNLTPPRISPSCTDCLYLSLCRSTVVGR